MADLNNNSRSLHLDNIVYGEIFPTILVVGFCGAVFNLLILYNSTSQLKSFHYNYIKGMTVCDLFVVILSIPFTIRLCNQKTEWESEYVAWYYAHLELYLVNTFCGTGVLLTVATTTERYLGFCHPFKARMLQLRHPKHSLCVVKLVPIITAILYLPIALHDTIQVEVSFDNATNITDIEYAKVENYHITNNVAYVVFNYFKEIVFRILPALILGILNARIIITYKRASRFLRRKKSMRIKVTNDEECKLKRDKRLIFVLIGLTLQFIICTTPAAILAITLDEDGSHTYEYEVFRSIANLLEITKNSSSFFVYCLCSAEYRHYARDILKKYSPKKITIEHIYK